MNFFKDHLLGIFILSVAASLAASYIYEHVSSRDLALLLHIVEAPYSKRAQRPNSKSVEADSSAKYQPNIDWDACSPETLLIVDDVFLGESYSDVRAILDGKHLKYFIRKDGGEIFPEDASEGGAPFEVLASFDVKGKHLFSSILMGRREEISIFFDEMKKVVRMKCHEVFKR